MKTLLILRHAKSSWDEPGLSDHDRPLKKRGRRDAARMGRLLRAQGLAPGLILSSTARRARETAEAVAEESGYSDEISFNQELYQSEPEVILAMLGQLEDSLESVLVIGHNPELEELLAQLTGEEDALPTAALARVELPIQSWKDLARPVICRLVNFWEPRGLE